MLMVTDVVRGSSRIILSNPPSILDELPYPPLPDNTRSGRRSGFEKETTSASCAWFVGELMTVYDRIVQALISGECCAVCTIIDTTGTTPRKIGSKMIVFLCGNVEGSIGGGAVENEIITCCDGFYC